MAKALFTSNKKINMGSMYFFRYDPVWKHKLHAYDRAPLVIPLEPPSTYGGKMFLGINIHWLPAKIRVPFVLLVLKMGEIKDVKYGRGTRKVTVTRLLYGQIKNNPSLRAGLVAIRKYYLSKMSVVREFPPESWTKIDPNFGKYKPRKIYSDTHENYRGGKEVIKRR